MYDSRPGALTHSLAAMFVCQNILIATINHHMDIECRMRPNQKRLVHAPATAATALSAAPAVAPIFAVAAMVEQIPVVTPASSASASASAVAAAAGVAHAPSISSSSSSAAELDSLVIPESEPGPLADSEPALLIDSTQEMPLASPTPPPPPSVASIAAAAVTAAAAGALMTSSTEVSSTAPEAAAATTAAAAAATPHPHPFFTSGPREASAFLPQRKARNEHVKCAGLVHFTACTAEEAAAAAASASLSVANGTAASAARTPGSGSGSAGVGSIVCEWQDCPDPAAAPHLPTLCAASALSAFHSHTKYEEPGDRWTELHLRASQAFLLGAPLDSAANNLANNPNVAHRGRRFNLSLSLLKSLLQKNVRLSRPAAAVRCAVQLINL